MTLPDLLASFTLAAVETQAIWDAEHAKCSSACPRMLLRQWECDLTLSLTATRDTSFRIEATPVNLGFALIHSSTHRNSSSLSIQVEQIPAPISYQEVISWQMTN